ncbi:hypothetical protein GNI_028650, partial [Gregarina niphandrodes]
MNFRLATILALAAGYEYECLGVPVRLWVHQGWRESGFADIGANREVYLQWADVLRNNIKDFDYGFSTFMDRLDQCTSIYAIPHEFGDGWWDPKLSDISDAWDRPQKPSEGDDGPEDSLSILPELVNRQFVPYTADELKILIIVTDDYGKYHETKDPDDSDDSQTTIDVHPTNPALEGNNVWTDTADTPCDTQYQYFKPHTILDGLQENNIHTVVLCTSGTVCQWWDNFFRSNKWDPSQGDYSVQLTNSSAQNVSDGIVRAVDDIN